MNINKIIYIFATLFLGLSLTSCLGESEEITISKKTILTSCSFGSDINVYTSNFVKNANGELVEVKDTTTYEASDFPFIIDQINNTIYTKDSLPVGSDISKMPITISSAGAYATRLVKDSNGNEVDTVWTSTDSLNLNNPVRLKIYASDETTTRIYTLTVKVHKVDPDSLVWNKISNSFSGGKVTELQRSIVLGENIITYAKTANGIKAYVTDYTDINRSSVENDIKIASTPDIESVYSYNNIAYITSEDGKIFFSYDGINWNEYESDGNVKAIVGKITVKENNNNTERLIVITEGLEGKMFRAIQNGKWLTEQAEVPDGFPVNNFCGFENKLTTNSRYRLNIMGREDENNAINDTLSFAWFTNDGLNWTKMLGASVYNLPKMTNPTYLYYNNQTIAFGTGPKEKFNNLYSSVEYGLVWNKNTRKVMLPYDFEGRESYSATVTPDNYIWIFWSKTGSTNDEVWRGRINELGFIQNNSQM